MNVECIRIQLKPDALPLVREWAARLNTEMETVKDLLRKEGMILESVFLEETPEGNSLLYYLRSEDLHKAREVSKASAHPLDAYHQQVMQKIAASAKSLTCLLDIAP